METDRVLRPCHSHLDGVAPPPVQPVAQEVTSSRDEASAPTETPPPGVAEPSLEPHPAEGQEHTTAHTSGSPPRPPSPASTPVPARGPALSCATPPLSSLTPPPRGAGEPSPPLIPGDPLGAQAAHGVPSTASSDATAPIDPADTATSPDQVMSCPTCRSSLANRRALQHHIPFCHPADAARRAQAAHDTASIIPSLSQPRATGMQFTDAQWQTLDSVDWTEYFSPERIHTRPLRRVPERVRGGYLDVLSAILVRIAQDPEAAGPTFLLAAAPTLFLVPATPPDRSHTAAIAARISRFGRAPDTQGTIQRLQSKHPNAERPTPAWLYGFQGSPLVLSVDHLRRAIFTAPRGSSGRTSNMDVRPIAIGEVLVRILSRAVCLQLRDQMARVFLASQPFGVGVMCGTEVVVRGVRRALADHPDWVVLQLDVANAFNSFHRDRMFQALQASPEFQCLIPFIGPLLRVRPRISTTASCFGAGSGEGDFQLWSYADDTYVLGPPARVLHHFAEIVRRLGEMGLAAQPHKCLVYQTESFLSRDLEAFHGPRDRGRTPRAHRDRRTGRHRFVRGAESPGSSREDGGVLPWLPRLRQPQTAARLLSACRQHSSAVPVEDRPSFARSDLQFYTVGRTPGRDISAAFSFRDLGLSRGRPRGRPRPDLPPHPSRGFRHSSHGAHCPSFASGEPEQIDRALQTALEGLPPDVLSLLPPWPSCTSASPDSLFAGASRLLEAHALEAVRARHASPLHLARLTSLQGGGAGAWLTSVPYADPLRIPEALWQAASSSRLGGQRGRQGEQTGQDGEGGRHRQQQESQWRPRAQGAAPPGSASGAGQGREQQRADGGTGEAAGLGGEGQGVREAAGDGARGSGGLGEGREGEGRGQVDGGEERGRETIGEGAPRDQTGQQPAQQQGPVGRTGRVGTASRIPDLTCRDVGQGLMVLVDVSIADPQREGNVQLRRATPTQIGVAAARRVQEKLRHWGPHLEGLQPAPHFYACVAETFGLLSEPMRQFLELCAKRIAQRRRDRGGGDDGSARTFEAGLTTRLSVALQRAQAQCMIQHASHPLPPHAIRSPRPYPPRARSLAASFDPPCPPRRFPPPAIRSSPPVRSPRLPSPPPSPPLLHASSFPSPTHSTPLPLLNPHPAPRISPPLCLLLPLPAPPSSPPCPSFSAPPHPVSPLPAPPFLSPCLSFAPSLPPPAHAPVFGFSPPCPTFLPSLPSPSAPPLFSPHPLLLPSLPFWPSPCPLLPLPLPPQLPCPPYTPVPSNRPHPPPAARFRSPPPRPCAASNRPTVVRTGRFFARASLPGGPPPRWVVGHKWVQHEDFPGGHRSRTATDPSTADERRIARCLRLAACNETSRACAALESAEAAPDTQGTIQRLQSKHPNAERPTPAFAVWLPGVPSCALGGSLTPRNFHSSAGLFGRTSNMDVRPIAIGEVLVRILSRAVCLQLRDQMARVFLASQQFGVGVMCGTEVVVRGVRRALADHPDWVVLQLDVANAFNSFHRYRMFQALQASPEFQCLIPFIGLFYGTPSDLHYRSGTGVVTMHSERGTRQGDPLSPFLYALTQRLALEPVLAEGDVQLWSYADDTYVLGPPDRVLHHFAEIVRRLGEMGLAAQPHKCLVYQTESFLSRDLEAFTGLGIEVARRGLTVTGVPVGTVSFVEQSLPDRLERMGRVLPWLPRLRQPQTAARLLSGVCQHSSAVPVEDRPSFARSDLQFYTIFLPIRLGGFGIRRMARIAPSFASGEPEQIDRALQTALEGLPPDVLSLLPPWPSCASASPDSLFAGASRLLEAHALEAVRARHASPLHLARLTSLQGGGAGAWLTSVPYADPLRIPEALWQAASSSRLGLPIPQLALAGQCSCGQAIDDMTVPHHAVRCPRYGVATTIHDTVKYMLRDFAVEAGFAVKVEDSTLFTQLEAARARLLGQPVVGEGTRAEGPGERRGEAGQPGGGGQWGRHQLRGQVERGTGGQRGWQGEQTGQDGEGGRHRQQQESQWRPRAQGAAPPGSASGAGQGREQQRADGGTGGAAGLGGEGQGVREAAGDGAGGSGGLGEGREGEGRGQVDGGEERGRETIGEGAPRDQTGQQPAQQQGPVGRTGRVGTASRIPDLTCRDVGQGLMVLVDVSIADPQREGNVQLRRATPTQIGVAAARRVQEKLRHWGPHLEGLQPDTTLLRSHPLPPHAIRSPRPYPPRARSLAASFDPPCPPRLFPTARHSLLPARALPSLTFSSPLPSSAARLFLPLADPLHSLPLLNPHPAPRISPPYAWFLPSLPLAAFLRPPPPPSPCPPTLPPLPLASYLPAPPFPPLCAQLLPSLPLPPPRPAPRFPPPHARFLPSPRLPFFLRASPLLPPCPAPAHAPVFGFSPPCPTFLPSLPTPSAPPLFSPHPLLLPSLPLISRTPALVSYHPCPSFPPLCTFSLFPPCPSLPPPLPFALPSWPSPCPLLPLPLPPQLPCPPYTPVPSNRPHPPPAARFRSPPPRPCAASNRPTMHYRPFPLIPHHAPKQAFLPPASRLPALSTAAPCPCVTLAHFIPPPPSPPPRLLPIITRMFPHSPVHNVPPPPPLLPSPLPLCPPHLYEPYFPLQPPFPPQLLPHPAWAAPLHPALPGPTVTQLPPPGTMPPFPPPSNLYTPCPCSLRNPATYPSLPLPLPNSTPPFLPPAKVYTPCFCSLGCAVPNLPPPFRGTRPPLPPPANLCTPCSCPLCPPTPYLNPPQSPPSPTPSIFPPPWGSPIRSYHPSSFPQFPLSPVSRPRILFCIYHSASFRCPLCPPTFSPPASQPSHYPLPGSRQLDYPLPFAPSSLFPTLPFPLGSTCPPPPPVEFCPCPPHLRPTTCPHTSAHPPLHHPRPPTSTTARQHFPSQPAPSPPPPLGPNPLQLSGPLYPLFHPLRTAFPTLFPFPQANPPHPGLCQGAPSPFDALLSQLQQLTPPPPGMLPLARGELAADTAREGVSEFVCEGAAEAAEDGAAKAAREGAMGVVGEGAAEAAEERAAEAAREGAAAAARERAAGAAREGAAGTVTLARQRAEAMETGFAGVGATEPAAVSAGGTAAEEAIVTAPVEAARTAAGATEATVGAGIGGGATGAAGKGVTGTGARESAAPAVAREGTAGARVGEGTAVASKAEGEAAAEAAGRAIARPVGAAGAAANAGKHTAGPAGPAGTAKGASSKAAAGGVGSGDIGATGEGEVSVVPTGVGTEEGDVIAIEEDEGEDVMHIDGPLAQYLTLDGEADPAPLQPHVEVPPLPPMPVPMLAEGPMEGLGETLRTEPREGAPILTSRPPAHPPPGAPLPHPHPQVPVVSRGAAKALAFLAEPCSPTPTLLHGQPPSPSPTPDPTVAGGPPGEHAAHLCPHPQGLLRAPRGAARALVFLEEPCSPTPTNTQPPPTGPLPPPPPGPPPPGSTHISEVEASLRPNPSPTRYKHPNHPSRRTAPTRPPNRLPSPHHPPQAAETHPQGLAPQAHGSGGTLVEGPTGEATTGPTQISLPPPFVPRSNLHTGPAPRPPPPTPSPGRVPHEWPRWAAITPHTQLARSVPTEGDVSRREEMHTEHPPPGEPPILPPPTPLAPQPPLPSQTGADNQVAAAAIATGREAVGLRDAPMADATDSPSHPSHPFHVDDPLPQPMVIGEGQGGLLGQGPHPSSAQPARPTPPSTLPALLLSPTGRQVFETPEELGASLPTPMETDRVLRPCHSHLDGVAPPPVQPVAQEVTSSRDEASAPTETPPPGVAEPSLEPHPAEGQEHTTAHQAHLHVPPPQLRHRYRHEARPYPAAHGVPSTASSDATAPIDPADTATSPDQVVSCPTCKSSLANRRALQHHIPFCHPADTARRAQAAHDTASIIPSLSQPRATGMQFTDAQWQTLDSVDWTEYFSPERIHTRPLRRVPERVRGGYLDVLSAILVRIAQDPEAAGPTFLLAAAPTLFLVPATPPDRSHTAAIAARISRFGRGEWAELVSDALGRRTPLPRRTGHRSRTATDPSTADERRIARCLRLAACNETSRACAALESAEAAPDTQGTIQRLQSKHPNAERPTPAWLSGFQGSPLVLSRLALEPVLAEGGVQLWSYADDTYVLGPPARVLHHFAEIVRRLGEMGLAAQPHKCLVYQTESFLSRDLEAFTGLGIEVARRGLTVTGVPVGTVSFVEQSLPDRLERMGRVLPWLPRLRQPQTAARLLSACVSTRPQYLSRTVPPSPAVISSFTRWDARLGETFQQLLASGTWACREDVREAALDQIFLPIRLGGFGIRRMARIAPVSFVCSWVQCAPILCSLPACGEVFQQSFASGEPEQIDRALQTALEGLPPDVLSLLPPWPSCTSASPDSLFAGASRLLEAHALEAVRARHASPLHLARLTSLQGGGAGAWLTSVPYADPLRIPEALWQAASSSRLGLPIPQLALAGQCSCGQAIDDMTVPHHAVRCPRYGVATTIHDTVKYMLRDFAVEAGFAVKVEDSTLFTQLEAARARLLGQPVVGEGTRAEGPGERRGEAGQPGGGGQWGRHQLRGQVERGTGGQRGRQGEQTGQDGEGGRHRQQQESQWRPRAQGAAPPGSASGAGQGREQQRADGGTGGAAGLGGKGQGVREAAGDGAGGSGGLGEGREGEGRGQVDGGEERGRETIGEGAPRDQTGQQPAQQQGPVGRTGRVGTASRIPDLTCRDVGQGLMVLVDVSIADPQREGNVQLRRATPTQIGVAAARRVQEKLRHWGPHLEGLQPAPHFYACVAETFGLLSEPLRQFLGLCAKRIAQRRRDRGGGDDGSARIFEAGFTTRLSVALQRAQAQCMIQHAVRQLGSHTPCPLMPSAPPAPTLRVPAPLPPLLTLPAPLAVSHRPPFAPPRPCAPLAYLLLPPPLLCCTPLPSPRRPTPLPAPPQSAPCPSYLAPLCLVSPLPAPRRLSPPPTSPLSLPPHSPPLALGFLPPCPTFPPSVCSASPLPAPPSSPPCPSFSSPPHPVSPLPAPPFLSPCLSFAPSLPSPARGPVFGFSPPCPTFLPSLPSPSAPPLFSPHPLLLPSLPLFSYHPCPSFPPLCTFSLFPPCPSLPPPLPFALPSLRSLLPIPAALLPPSAHPHHQPPSHPSLPPSLSLSLFLTHTHAHSPPPPPHPHPPILPLPAPFPPPRTPLTSHLRATGFPPMVPPLHRSPLCSPSARPFSVPPAGPAPARCCPSPCPLNSPAPRTPQSHPTAPTLPRLPVSALHPRDRARLPTAQRWCARGHYRPFPLIPHHAPKQAFLPPASRLPALSTAAPCPCVTLAHFIPPPPSPPPRLLPIITRMFPHSPVHNVPPPPPLLPSPLPLCPPHLYEPYFPLQPPFPPQLLPHPAWAAPLHPALPGPSVTQLPPPGTTPPFPPPSNLYTPCPCSLRNPATYPSLPLPLPNSTPPFLPPAKVYTPCFCSLGCAVPNLPPPFRGTRPPLPPPANLCTPCSCPLCPPTPYLNPPPVSPFSNTLHISSPLGLAHPHASFWCPLCPPTFSPPASQPSHYPLPGSRQLDYPLPFAPSSLFPTLPFPLGSTCPPPPPVEFCPALPTSGPPPVPTPCSPTATSPPPPHLHYSPPTLPLSTGPQPAPPLGPNPLQLARGELAADTAREGVSEFVCEGAAEAAEDGAAKAAREGAMGVVGEGAAEAAEERAAEAAREGAAAAARERAAGAAQEGAAGTVTLARQRAEAMETGFAGVGATEPAAVSAGGTAAEEAIGTAPVEAARTAAGATEATVGAGIGGGATGAAGKGVTGTGARESAAPAVAREGTAGARVGEGTAVASKAEGEAAAEAAGRAIARPVGAAGAAANAGKHTAGPAGPAGTAKGASSKAAAGGVGSGDIGATGEGEVSVVPTGVGTEEGDVIAIEEDEGEDVMHIDGPLAQYLTLDGPGSVQGGSQGPGLLGGAVLPDPHAAPWPAPLSVPNA
ncbi:unnamed protein product [Closterium sp. NIES-65]|nr:unnamed protein product [Closterium sp. NIES-65]